MREELKMKIEGPTADYISIIKHEATMNQELKKQKEKSENNLKKFKERFEAEITSKLERIELSKENELRELK